LTIADQQEPNAVGADTDVLQVTGGDDAQELADLLGGVQKLQ